NFNWNIKDSSSGLVSCHNKEKLNLHSQESINEQFQIDALAFHKNDSPLIEIKNISGIYASFPQHLEGQCADALTQNHYPISAIIGTGLRIAPLHDERLNITTNIIPIIIEQEEIFAPDYSDGGFYCDSAGVMRQLKTQTLDFATGEIYVVQPLQNEQPAWPEFRMVMCLDQTYQEKMVINNQTLFDYERAMREELRIPNLLVRMAVDSYNGKAVGIRFPKDAPAYTSIKDSLQSEPGFQFSTIASTYQEDQYNSDKPFDCVFAPIEKVELLHKALWLTVLKNQTANLVDGQITKLSESHFWLRNDDIKISHLKELKLRLDAAHPESTKEELLEIIKIWESEEREGVEPEDMFITNKLLMGRHRNIFFSAHRPGVLTSTETFIATLKTDLGEVPQEQVVL
ncbi:MAG: hypothetical protein K2X39_01120, partial [Silvanigrellaceae bacterium]|nr:hypothetical protein [Silvanigrellaceae bacterium]